MTQRLAGVIAALNRQPDTGIRQVLALPRDEAERFLRLSWVAIISITAPGRQLAKLDGFRVSFADVDYLSPTLSPKARATLGDTSTVEQAHANLSVVSVMLGEVRPQRKSRRSQV
ncbi:hypothetical protein [Burkholderia ubonensis]|uniref:hypothetical protein n=1 Tax=Burkholderia ubonensis TaxID=101571 RepID=UPI0012F7B764|nr:hypothetical protein [Burkholderia ubonensis]